MEKSKATFSGETLELLKKLSPKIKALAADKTSVEIKADDLFKFVKKGKTIKEKFFLFVKAVQPSEGQPLFIKKKFTVEVRSNWSSKAEIEEILKEAGISDTKSIFQRGKDFVEGKLKEGVASNKPAVQKGKAEHASQFRGARSMRGRYHGEGPPENENDFFEEMSPEEAWFEASMREPTKEERIRSEKYAEERRKAQAERNTWHREFKAESAAAWAKKFPGKAYPPEDPGWQWDHNAKEWQYFSAPGANPFYNDEYMFGRSGAPGAMPRGPGAMPRGPGAMPGGPGAMPRSENEARPPKSADPKNIESCKQYLLKMGIKNRKNFLKWAIKNHPDIIKKEAIAAGNSDEIINKKEEEAANIFKIVSNCVDTVQETFAGSDDWHIGPKEGGTRKQKLKKKGTRRV
jgi:hypothetical protein